MKTNSKVLATDMTISQCTSTAAVRILGKFTPPSVVAQFLNSYNESWFLHSSFYLLGSKSQAYFSRHSGSLASWQKKKKKEKKRGGWVILHLLCGYCCSWGAKGKLEKIPVNTFPYHLQRWRQSSKCCFYKQVPLSLSSLQQSEESQSSKDIVVLWSHGSMRRWTLLPAPMENSWVPNYPAPATKEKKKKNNYPIWELLVI